MNCGSWFDDVRQDLRRVGACARDINWGEGDGVQLIHVHVGHVDPTLSFRIEYSLTARPSSPNKGKPIENRQLILQSNRFWIQKLFDRQNVKTQTFRWRLTKEWKKVKNWRIKYKRSCIWHVSRIFKINFIFCNILPRQRKKQQQLRNKLCEYFDARELWNGMGSPFKCTNFGC